MMSSLRQSRGGVTQPVGGSYCSPSGSRDVPSTR